MAGLSRHLSKLLTLPTRVIAFALATGSTSADWRTDIGWDDFKAELGGGYPDGTNVLVVQSEADGNGAKQELNPWDRTLTRPIDDIYGAGEVNILNSYHILAAGEQSTGSATSTDMVECIDIAAKNIGERNYQLVETPIAH